MLLVGITGCNSDGNTDNTNTPRQMEELIESSDGSSTFSDITGIYAYPDAGNGNEGYLVIGTDGSFIEFDYAGDSFAAEHDEYGNCYWTINDGWKLKQTSTDRYTIDKGDNIPAEELEFSDEDLKVYFVIDDVVSEHSETYNKEDNLNVSDLTPECESTGL